MKVRRTNQQVSEADLLAKEATIRANALNLFEAEQMLWEEKAKRAVDWILAHASDKTFGGRPSTLRIAKDDDYGLAAFEDYGRRGNAVLLHDGDIGQVWWCDPEGKASKIAYFALTKGAGCSIVYEIRFVTP
jgi:hypothetical protein